MRVTATLLSGIQAQRNEATLATECKTASGLFWSTETINVNLVAGSRERLKFANIKQLPESGMFAAELAALDPGILAVAIDVEGNVDLTGIESMPCLVHLLIHGSENAESRTISCLVECPCGANLWMKPR